MVLGGWSGCSGSIGNFMTDNLSVKTPTFYHGLPEVEVSDNDTAFTSTDLESS